MINILFVVVIEDDLRGDIGNEKRFLIK